MSRKHNLKVGGHCLCPKSGKDEKKKNKRSGYDAGFDIQHRPSCINNPPIIFQGMMLQVAKDLIEAEDVLKVKERDEYMENSCPPLVLPHSKDELQVLTLVVFRMHSCSSCVFCCWSRKPEDALRATVCKVLQCTNNIFYRKKTFSLK